VLVGIGKCMSDKDICREVLQGPVPLTSVCEMMCTLRQRCLALSTDVVLACLVAEPQMWSSLSTLCRCSPYICTLLSWHLLRIGRLYLLA